MMAMHLGVIGGDEFLHPFLQRHPIPVVDNAISRRLKPPAAQAKHGVKPEEPTVLVGVPRHEPSVLCIWLQRLPPNLTTRQELEFLALPPHLRHAMIAQLFRCVLLLHRERNTHADLNAEHVVRGPGKLRIAAHVPVQVDVIHPIKVLQEVLAHAVERKLVHKAVVRHEAHDPVAALEPVCGPAEELHIHVRQRVLVRRLGTFGVGLPHPLVNPFVLPVLVVIVLALLPHVVRRVADNHRDGGFFLPLHAFGVGGGEHGALPRHVERVHETQAGERLVLLHPLIVGVLDVQAGDIIRQQHHFVGEKAVLIGFRQRFTRHTVDQVDDEIPSPGARIENHHFGRCQRVSEFLFQRFLDRLAHVVDNLARRVDDAVGIGHIRREALEELLVYGVEKILLLGEVAEVGSGALDGRVVRVQVLEEILLGKTGRSQRFDHVLHLRRNHVPRGELGVLEQVAHQPLGEQVLDQHLVHVAVGQFRVQRRAAQGHKCGESFAELPVLLVRFVDVVAERLRQVRNAQLELVHGALELTLIGFIVGEEAVHQLRYLQWLAERVFASFAAVLVEDGGLRVLEDGVAGRVAGLDLLLNFGGEFVGGVLGFPPAARQAEFVAHGAVGDHALAAGVSRKLRNQRPAALFGGLIEQVLERSLQPQLVYHVLTLQMLEVLEIRLDQRIGWGELEHWRLLHRIRRWAARGGFGCSKLNSELNSGCGQALKLAKKNNKRAS